MSKCSKSAIENGKNLNQRGRKNAMKKLQGKRGITLIALVITIIVLLILAGVTIATLTGNNGILGQAQKAQESTKIGKFRDQAQLAYMEVYATNAQNGVYTVGIGELISKLQEPQYGYTFQPVPTGSISGITVKQNGVVVNTTNAATVEKADETPAETTATLTVIPAEGEGVDYYIEEDGMYYKISLSGAEITIGEGQATAGNTGGGNPTLRIENEENLQKLETEVEGLTITVVGRTAGEETLEISYGGQTANVKVVVTETFAVNFYTSSTATEATPVKVASGGNALSVAGYATARTAADNAAPTGEVFDKWVLKTAVGENAVGTDATTLLGNVTQNLNVYATYEEAPEFGEADATLKSHFGKTVLTSSDITFGTAGWQLLYADSENLYLIYADYLENGKIPSGTNITKSGYSVYSSSNRDTLINYLKTESNWTSVSSVFNTKYGVTGITAKGAPTPDMWAASYNARYGTKLGAKNFKTTGQTYYEADSSTGELKTTTGTTSATGYMYTRDNTVAEEQKKWELFLHFKYMSKLSGYPGSGNSNMYYPHTSSVSASSTTTYGYWLARSFGSQL